MSLTLSAFRHFWIHCQLIGLLSPKRFKPLYYFYSLILNVPSFILLTGSYVFYFIYDLEDLFELLRVFQDFLPVVTTNIKTIIFYFSCNDLRRIDSDFDALEAHPSFSKKDYIRIQKMISVSKMMFIFYIFCNNAYILIYALTALGQRERSLLFPLWFPFDWNSNDLVYCCVFAYQVFLGLIIANRSVPVDIYPSQHLLAICEHFDIMASRVKDIGWNPEVSLDDNYEQLLECIKMHKRILRIFHDLANLMSKTLSCQFMMTAFALCSSLVPIFIGFALTPLFVIRIALLIAVLLLPIYPCCYYGHTFMDANASFTTVLFSCNWPDQTIRFKKTLLIFMTTTSIEKPVILGKMFPVNLLTLMKLLKFTYTLITFIMQIA